MALTRLLISSFLRCAHCDLNSELESLPLCPSCAETLRSSRSCRFELGNPVDSGFAVHQLGAGNYPILKSWKKRRGPFFDQKVLNSADSAILQWLRESGPSAEVVIPIPQNPRRAMKMGGSPARFLSEWLSSKTALPISELLRRQNVLFQKRQAELDSSNRLLNPMNFEVAPDWEIPRSVILVDDFVTTGHTIREAARALKLGGVAHVRAFGLGVRLIRREQELHLLKGA